MSKKNKRNGQVPQLGSAVQNLGKVYDGSQRRQKIKEVEMQGITKPEKCLNKVKDIIKIRELGVWAMHKIHA